VRLFQYALSDAGQSLADTLSYGPCREVGSRTDSTRLPSIEQPGAGIERASGTDLIMTQGMGPQWKVLASLVRKGL
jgi:hypothetical protein